ANERMGAPLCVAATRYDLARLLLARGAANDRARARECLEAAAATARQLGLKALEERTEAIMKETGLVRAPAGEGPAAPPERDVRLLALELGRACAERLDLDELCRFVTAKCREVLDAEGAAVLLIDRHSGEFHFPYAADDDAGVASRLQAL